ncbi:MAG: hypothetical protein VW619_11520 [Rhodobiaceae bacterium]
MSGSWPALRDSDRDLALCLLFSPASMRPLLADRLSLALEAENSLRVASEPMLAAIRLQWWVEAIEAGRDENVPLMRRLLAHLDAGHMDQCDLLAQLAIWQDRLADDRISAAACWQRLFVMLAGMEPARHAAGLVGMSLLEGVGASRLDDDTLAVLRRRPLYWIWMAGQVARYRGSDKYRDDDALLVWRMLGWRLGITRPSPSPSP